MNKTYFPDYEEHTDTEIGCKRCVQMQKIPKIIEEYNSIKEYNPPTNIVDAVEEREIVRKALKEAGIPIRGVRGDVGVWYGVQLLGIYLGADPEKPSWQETKERVFSIVEATTGRNRIWVGIIGYHDDATPDKKPKTIIGEFVFDPCLPEPIPDVTRHIHCRGTYIADSTHYICTCSCHKS